MNISNISLLLSTIDTYFIALALIFNESFDISMTLTNKHLLLTHTHAHFTRDVSVGKQTVNHQYKSDNNASPMSNRRNYRPETPSSKLKQLLR